MRGSVRLVALMAAVSIAALGCTSSGVTPAPSGGTAAPSDGATPTTAESSSVAPSSSATPTAVPSAAPTSSATPILPPIARFSPRTFVPLPLHNRILYRIDRDWWLISTDGTNKMMVADDYPQPVLSPGPGPWAYWAADGLKVHYVRWNIADKCRPQLIDVNPATGAQTIVPAALLGNDNNFAWSPDGTKIAFTRSQANKKCIHTLPNLIDHRDLMMMNADGTNIQIIKLDVDYFTDYWMPDGSAIVADTELGMVRVDPVTGADTMMAPGVVQAKVSPNSGLVAYQSGGSLLVRPVSGLGPPVNLGPVSTWGASLDYDWAPDGHSLAVVRNVVIGATTHQRPFHVTYPGGAAVSLGLDGKSPSWSPDSVHFACATTSLIGIFNVAGLPITQIPNSGGAESVFWQP